MNTSYGWSACRLIQNERILAAICIVCSDETPRRMQRSRVIDSPCRIDFTEPQKMRKWVRRMGGVGTQYPTRMLSCVCTFADSSLAPVHGQSQVTVFQRRS